MSSDLDHDFGFTAVSADDSETKLDKMYKAIMTLLVKLKENPKQEYIHWPNREAKINQFMQKIEKIRNS